MIRTQIQLTELQVSALKNLATQRQQSIAELIRQSINRFLAEETSVEADPQKIRQRAILEPGLFRSGLPDVARNHDKYLVEAYSNGLYMDPYNEELDDE
ncbi:MAG: CopG family transcriptional regulator [Caldilineaceae bacterium]